MYLPRRGNPFEPVDRRWLRSNHLAGQPRPRWHRTDDRWVRLAVTYIRALNRCRGERQRRRLAERMPALHLAHAIHQADPPLLRWAVEARILAAEDFDSIARKCGTTAEAIECYEAMFFSVLDKLRARTYIICQVIGRKIHHGLSEDDLDVIWKFFGYVGGPLLLDSLIDGFTAQPRPESQEQVDPFLAKDARSTLLRKLALAARVLPVTPETALPILKGLAHLLEPQPALNVVAGGPVTPDLRAIVEHLQGLAEGVVYPGDGTVEKDSAVPEPIRRRSGVLLPATELVTR